MISKKGQEIPPFLVMDVLEKAQELERNGEHIIHLEVGEPDFDTPECINEACYRAICEGKTHYTHSLGLIELREAIAEDYWNKYQVKVSPEQILIASGTSPAMLVLFAALLEPNDEVILSNPLTIVWIAIPLFIQTNLIFWIAYGLARFLRLNYRDAAPSAMIGASNHFEVAIATATMLFGLSSGAALATVVGVLIEVPVMLMLVKICLRTQKWFTAEAIA